MTGRVTVGALVLAVAGMLCLGGGIAAAQSQLVPSLTVDTAFAPPDGVARDGAAGTGTDIPGGVAVDGNRIYTVGESNGDVAIVARRTNGTYDTDFAGDGRLDLALGNGKDVGVAITVLPDRRLRVLASTDADPSSSTNTDVAVIGLNPDGTDDLSFGGGGRVSFPVGPIDDMPSRMAIDAMGRIAIVGWRKDANGKEDTFVSLRAPDGSPVASFGPGDSDGDGITTIDRAGGNINDRGIDVVFRPGGGLVALLQVATNPDTNINNYVAVLHAFTETGADDTGFSDDADLVLAVGEPNTIPGGLLLHAGRLWATGSTKVAVDTDAFLARVEGNGSGFQFRRFDMRGGRIPDDQGVVSGGGDLDVLPGTPNTLVVVGSITYSSRTFWAAAAFQGIEGDLAQAGYGDLLIPTEEYGALLGVSAGNGWLATAGSLLNVNGNFDTSFGTARLLVDANKRCDLGVEVPEPLEVLFAGNRPEPIKVRVTNVGSKSCAGLISVPTPYGLRLGGRNGALPTGVLAPGAAYTTSGALLTYSGARRREDVLQVQVKAPGDANPENDASLVNVIFSYCDVELRPAGSAALAPTEGSRSFEFSLRNTGTAPCRRVHLVAGAGARIAGATDPFTLDEGRSASEEVTAAVAGERRIGRRARLVFRALSDADVEPRNDSAALSPLLVGVGDTDARRPGPAARGFSGRARGGRGPVARRRLRVMRVHIAVRRLGRGCRWLASRAGRFRNGGARRCDRPLWLRASGTRRWRFSVPRGLPRGRYVLYSRATIAAGFREASFSSRDRNRIVFRAG